MMAEAHLMSLKNRGVTGKPLEQAKPILKQQKKDIIKYQMH